MLPLTAGACVAGNSKRYHMPANPAVVDETCWPALVDLRKGYDRSRRMRAAHPKRKRATHERSRVARPWPAKRQALPALNGQMQVPPSVASMPVVPRRGMNTQSISNGLYDQNPRIDA